MSEFSMENRGRTRKEEAEMYVFGPAFPASPVSAKEATMMDDSKYQSNRTEILFLARPSRAAARRTALHPYFTDAMRRIYHPIKIDSPSQIANNLLISKIKTTQRFMNPFKYFFFPHRLVFSSITEVAMAYILHRQLSNQSSVPVDPPVVKLLPLFWQRSAALKKHLHQNFSSSLLEESSWPRNF